jgi:hypothetical protein
MAKKCYGLDWSYRSKIVGQSNGFCLRTKNRKHFLRLKFHVSPHLDED